MNDSDVPPSGSGSPRPRDAVVAEVLRIEETLGRSRDNERELRRLTRAIRNSLDRFSLFFAECNDPNQRDGLIAQLKTTLQVGSAREIRFTGQETSVLDVLLEATQAETALLFVMGLENLLPSAPAARALRHRTLQELQHRREQFRQLACPVVFWVPEYVYALLGRSAVDFWSWQRASFHFSEAAAPGGRPEEGAAPVDLGPFAIQPEMPAQSGAPDVSLHKKELEQVLQAVRSGKHILIVGAGGTGKTSLLRAAMAQSTLEFERFVYADFGFLRRQTAEGVLQYLISQIVPELVPEGDLATLTGVFRSVLHNRRALLAIDDVPGGISLEPFVPPAGSILMAASRANVSLPDSVEVRLGAVRADQAVSFLLDSVRGLSPAIASKLASTAECVPFTLRLIADALKEPGVNPAEFEKDLQRSGSYLLQRVYSRLPAHAAAILRRMVVFPGSFDAAAESEICLDTGNEKLHLLERDSYVTGTEPRRYRMETSLKERLKRHVEGSDELAATQRRFAQYYLGVVEQAATHFPTGDLAWLTVPVWEG